MEHTIADFKKLPPYVSLNGTMLRLNFGVYDLEYFRDAGLWEVTFTWGKGKLLAVSDKNWLDGVELTPVTYLEWLADNKGYVSKKTKAIKVKEYTQLLNEYKNGKCNNSTEL